MTFKSKALIQIYPQHFYVPLLIAASAVFLYIGLSTPIMTMRKLWEKNTVSIMSGIESLWKDQDHVLALIIFFFSIVFPIVKLASLFLIWIIPLANDIRKKVISLLEVLGRWSMLDVFVSAVLIVAIKLGPLAETKVEGGIYYFSASILLAMLAATIQGYLIRKIK